MTIYTPQVNPNHIPKGTPLSLITKKLHIFSHTSDKVPISFGLIFKFFLIGNCLIEFFFAGNGFSTFRNVGIDTKNLKIGPNLAILDKSLYFLLKSYTLHSKVALEKIQNCPKTAKFGPIFKFFVSVPPFRMVLNPFWEKKIHSDNFQSENF